VCSEETGERVKEKSRKTGIADHSREPTLNHALKPTHRPVFTRVLRHFKILRNVVAGSDLSSDRAVDRNHGGQRSRQPELHRVSRGGQRWMSEEAVFEAKGRVLVWLISAYCILLGLAFRSGANADSYAYVIEF
jgi:hypothetical protein